MRVLRSIASKKKGITLCEPTHRSHQENEKLIGHLKGFRGMSEKGEEIETYKLVVTEWSQGCKVQHMEQSSHGTYTQDS